MKISYTLPIIALLLTSCATTSVDKQTEQLIVAPETLEEAKKVVGYECTYVKKTGTRINKKVCTTLAQREAAKKRSEQFVNEYRENNIPVPKQTGQ